MKNINKDTTAATMVSKESLKNKDNHEIAFTLFSLIKDKKLETIREICSYITAIKINETFNPAVLVMLRNRNTKDKVVSKESLEGKRASGVAIELFDLIDDKDMETIRIICCYISSLKLSN